MVAAFLEFAFVLQLHRGNEPEDTDERTYTKNIGNGKSSTLMEETSTLMENSASERKPAVASFKAKTRNEEKPRVNIRKIDLGAFVVGLLLFLVFNLVYWMTFSLYSFN